MEGFEFSPRLGELPAIIEEELPPPADQIFLYADGTLTLRDMSAGLDAENAFKDPHSMGFEKAINFLTAPSRQLIKFAPDAQHLNNPYKPFNSVPRNLSHSFKIELDQNLPERLNDFHQNAIADASWEFDWIEPTLNHAFRFPSDVFEGQDYGSRFRNATLSAEIMTFPTTSPLEVLEVGGGTGSFAVSFLRQASQVSQTSTSPVTLNYHIVDLSPALMVNQQALHSALPTKVTYLQQNAVELDIPGCEFDLIMANEVIADFPTAEVTRVQAGPGLPNSTYHGAGAEYILKYDLPVADAPEHFHVNAGVFDFIERAWNHLKPDGAVVLSEYGGDTYPVRQSHLNHDEYSIHFGHVMASASKIGFKCRLVTLKQFLNLNDDVLTLDGSAEHILCLNYVLQKFGSTLPYAAISKREFQARFQEITEQIGLVGPTFSPLKAGFHYGPKVNEFKVLILKKPQLRRSG